MHVAFFLTSKIEIMPLKYNPLLKFNLQESEDAEEILGDGYNEKLLTGDDFIKDCQTILTDTGEIRKYLFSGWSVNLPAKLNCNFSCEINFLPINAGNFIMNPPKFKGRYVKLFGVHLDGLPDINSEEFILQYCSIRSRGNLSFSNNCFIKIIDCPVESFYSSTWQISVSKRSVISIINSSFNYNFINPNLISLYTDGSVTFNNNNQQAQFIKYINIDSALDINSRGLLPNSVITAALQALTPDASLDAVSSKAIQNKAVTAAINAINQSIGSITNKVSKFHSATDSLIENEIAQYQGEDDSDNGLTHGYFYEQGQAWQKVPAGTTQTVTVNQYWRVTDVNDNVTDYYDLGYNYLNNFFKILHTTDNTIYIYMFTGLLNNDLNTYQADGKTYYVYPFAKVNNTFDFDNALEVIENNFFYNGNLLSIAGSAEGGFILGEKLLNLAKDTLYLSAYQSNAPFLFEFDSSENLLLTSPLKNAYIKNETTVSITAESVTYTDYTIQAGAAGFVPVQVQDLTQLNNLIASINTFTTDSYTNDHSSETPPYVVTCQVIKNQFLAQVNVIITAGTTVPAGTQLNDIGITLKDDFYINSNIVITAAGKLITNSALSSGIYSATVILN